MKKSPLLKIQKSNGSNILRYSIAGFGFMALDLLSQMVLYPNKS
jgi:hypothetical protein